MSYEVYTAEYAGSPNHIGIFVKLEATVLGKGRQFHVVGNTVVRGGGMRYEDKPYHHPSYSLSYVPKSLEKQGSVKESNLDRLSAICKAVPVPGEQLTLGGKLLDKSKPLRRCTEWTHEALQALRAEGVLEA